MKQSHWLLWQGIVIGPEKIRPLLKLTQLAPRGMKTYRTWTAISTNVKENAGKSSQFLSSKQLCEPKSLDEEYARKTRGCAQQWRPFDSSFEWKEGYRRWKFVSSVVIDSQISLTWYRRHLMAAIQLAASCGELYFSRCCALKRTGTFASESKVRCLF